MSATYKYCGYGCIFIIIDRSRIYSDLATCIAWIITQADGYDKDSYTLIVKSLIIYLVYFSIHTLRVKKYYRAITTVIVLLLPLLLQHTWLPWLVCIAYILLYQPKWRLNLIRMPENVCIWANTSQCWLIHDSYIAISSRLLVSLLFIWIPNSFVNSKFFHSSVIICTVL